MHLGFVVISILKEQHKHRNVITTRSTPIKKISYLLSFFRIGVFAHNAKLTRKDNTYLYFVSAHLCSFGSFKHSKTPTRWTVRTKRILSFVLTLSIDSGVLSFRSLSNPPQRQMHLKIAGNSHIYHVRCFKLNIVILNTISNTIWNQQKQMHYSIELNNSGCKGCTDQRVAL